MKSENDIPKFDLAEQILAGQRKFSSIKRKAPSKNRISDRDSNRNIETKGVINNNTSNPVPNPEPVPVNDISCDKIISEIVARDIRSIRSRRISG